MDLNKKAVSCASGEDAAALLGAYVQTPKAEMAQSYQGPTAAPKTAPTNTGAVDPNPLKG
jgi:hypothetical protein